MEAYYHQWYLQIQARLFGGYVKMDMNGKHQSIIEHAEQNAHIVPEEKHYWDLTIYLPHILKSPWNGTMIEMEN